MMRVAWQRTRIEPPVFSLGGCWRCGRRGDVVAGYYPAGARAWRPVCAECDAAIGCDVNVGSGREISVGDLAAKLIELTGASASVVTDEERLRPEKSEVERLLASSELVRELTGWEPRVSLDDGLRRTVEWFRDEANRARYKWDTYNV